MNFSKMIEQPPSHAAVRDFFQSQLGMGIGELYASERGHCLFVTLLSKADYEQVLAVKQLQIGQYRMLARPAHRSSVARQPFAGPQHDYQQAHHHHHHQHQHALELPAYPQQQQPQQRNMYATHATVVKAEHHHHHHHHHHHQHAMHAQPVAATASATKTVVISGLPSGATEETVFFRLYPHEPQMIRLIETTNCAAVTFASADMAAEAVRFLDGKTLQQRPLQARYV